jgi:hypothetical protein
MEIGNHPQKMVKRRLKPLKPKPEEQESNGSHQSKGKSEEKPHMPKPEEHRDFSSFSFILIVGFDSHLSHRGWWQGSPKNRP